MVLALDTSTDRATLALLRREGGVFELVGGRATPAARSHTHSLLRTVEECLVEAQAEVTQLGGLVVGIGPGTFTGVRIAVATARALALSLAIPILGVPSLTGLAAGALVEGLPEGVDALVPLLDARRGQVFGAVYLRPADERDGVWARSGEMFVCEPGSVPEAARAEAPDLGGRMLFLGKAQGVPGETRESAPHARHLVQGQDRLLEPMTKVPRLESWLGEQLEEPLDWARVVPGSLGTPEAVYPVYVRAPDADLHITKMRDPWAS